MALILILRHAHYYGNGDVDCPVSEDIGKKDIAKVFEAFFAFQKGKYPSRIPKTVSFAFSSALRVIRTAQMLGFFDHDMIVRSLFIADRDKILETELNEIYLNVMKTVEIYEAEVVIIVAHGQMPAMFAETAHRFITSKEIQLENTMTCCGYVIDTSGPGVIHSVDPRYGLFDVTYKKEEVVEPVTESKPAETSKGSTSKKVSKVGEGRKFDDDIPF